jgi:hypothetical protein
MIDKTSGKIWSSIVKTRVLKYVIEESPVTQLLSKRNLLALAILLIGGVLVIYFQPPTQPASEDRQLKEIQSIETLRAQFNRDTGKTRLILLLSPT